MESSLPSQQQDTISMIENSRKLSSGQQALERLAAVDAEICEQMLKHADRPGSVTQLPMSAEESIPLPPLLGDGYAFGGSYHGHFLINADGLTHSATRSPGIYSRRRIPYPAKAIPYSSG